MYVVEQYKGQFDRLPKFDIGGNFYLVSGCIKYSLKASFSEVSSFIWLNVSCYSLALLLDKFFAIKLICLYAYRGIMVYVKVWSQNPCVFISYRSNIKLPNLPNIVIIFIH